MIVFIKRGSSCDLFKFLKERGATGTITNFEWEVAIDQLDTDLRKGINKADLAVRLSDFYSY